MIQFTAFLSHVDAGGLALVGLLAAISWVRRRGHTEACLAAALGLLGLVSVLGQVQLLTPLPWFVSVVDVAAFMGSGYALVELRHQIIPLRPGRRTAVRTLLVLTTAVAIPLSVGRGMARPGLPAWLVASALVLEWAGCIAEPAVRFLRASRGLPAVQRNRLRAMSAGYLSMVLATVLALGAAVGGAAVSAAPNPVAGLVFQLVATAVIPLLYIGLATPSWLRRVWRDREAGAYRRGNEALLTFTATSAELGAHAVEWATRFVGAEAGLMLAADGSILARRGLDDDATTALADRARHAHPDHPDADGIAIVPVPTGAGDARLVVVAGPFTPVFGNDELLTLRGYANAVAVALDRVRVSESLNHQTKRLESVLQAVSDLGAGLVIADNGCLTYANDAYLALTGFSAAELEGRQLADLVPQPERAQLADRLAELDHESRPARFETRVVHRDQAPANVEIVFSRLADEGPGRVIALVQDISARQRAERALAETARLDAVTGTPNRRAWQEELAASLDLAAFAGEKVCVAILDLDGFKDYNDDWGHQRGDQLLTAVARAWRGALREEDFLARYGGDEFAVMMPGCSLSSAGAVLQRVLSASPHEASIGVAEWDGNESADELVARADGALLSAKRTHRGTVTEADQQAGRDRFVSWSARLEQVLSRRYLTSAYQPIVALDGGGILGYEALLRMTGSAAGSSVEELFQTAQRLGQTRALDWLGRRSALESAAGLPDDALLFVNVSARSLLDPVHGSDQMLMLLRWTQRRPAEIVLEISEREIISDLDRFCTVLADYRSHGFRFAHDDVGEGHSTLEVLAAANAEFIKIARSLTESVHKPGPRAAVRAIITFAAASGATVIAEGISDPTIAAVMRDLGVAYGQGYALGKPQYFPAGAPPAEALQAG